MTLQRVVFRAGCLDAVLRGQGALKVIGFLSSRINAAGCGVRGTVWAQRWAVVRTGGGGDDGCGHRVLC